MVPAGPPFECLLGLGGLTWSQFEGVPGISQRASLSETSKEAQSSSIPSLGTSAIEKEGENPTSRFLTPLSPWCFESAQTWLLPPSLEPGLRAISDPGLCLIFNTQMAKVFPGVYTVTNNTFKELKLNNDINTFES